jgi:hypothetical protein
VRLGGPKIDVAMLIPLLVMAVGFSLLFLALTMLRMRTALNDRKALAMRLNRRPGPAVPAERERLAPAGPAVRREA